MTVPVEPIRVMVVDDHAIVREGVRRVFAGFDDFALVAEAGDGETALALAEEHAPDVVLLDLTMPGLSGLDVTARLKERAAGTRVLILSMHDHPEYVLRAVRAGAHGYVLKDATPEHIREAVRTVHAGSEYFSPPVAAQLSAALRGEIEVEQRRGLIERLSPREREVLIEVANGRSNKEIGAALGISSRTVETHRESLVRKLRIRTVAGLTRFALQAGLISR
ncbi:MAG TPA: response regulator transcription factor [Gemmatimonadales bacterium]